MPHHTVVIRLELHLDDDALTGRASDGKAAREFTGWMGLVAAIDALLPETAPLPRAQASVGDPDEGESS